MRNGLRILILVIFLFAVYATKDLTISHKSTTETTSQFDGTGIHALAGESGMLNIPGLTFTHHVLKEKATAFRLVASREVNHLECRWIVWVSPTQCTP